MKSPSFAIVDDDTNFCGLAAEIAAEYGFEARGMHSVDEAKRWLQNHSPDLMLLDVRLPDGSGYEVLETLTSRHLGKVVMVSGSADAREVARAVSSHASDYWLKPLHTSKLLDLLRNVASTHSDRQAAAPDTLGLVGASTSMGRLRTDIRRAAASSVHVMLFGEAGAGKASVARAIHSASGADGALVTVNCSTPPRDAGLGMEALVDAFDRARSGTLYLQDIDLLEQGLQRQLAGFMRSVQGDRAGHAAGFTRIIASTGEPMDVAASLMHTGLFYRLYEHGIHLPPLRERGHDLDLLARHFLNLCNARSGTVKRLGRLSDSVRNYPWPGNVRELANIVRQAHSGTESSDLLLRVPRSSYRAAAVLERTPSPATEHAPQIEEGREVVVIPLGTPMREVEQRMLEATLKCCNGDKTAASRVLGVSTRTIHNWVRRQADADARSVPPALAPGAESFEVRAVGLDEGISQNPGDGGKRGKLPVA
jgi:DNA-binding NtrC family response regulator